MEDKQPKSQKVRKYARKESKVEYDWIEWRVQIIKKKEEKMKMKKEKEEMKEKRKKKRMNKRVMEKPMLELNHQFKSHNFVIELNQDPDKIKDEVADTVNLDRRFNQDK